MSLGKSHERSEAKIRYEEKIGKRKKLSESEYKDFYKSGVSRIDFSSIKDLLK